MERAKIVVEGEVLGVGYRNVVRSIARKLGIKGYIRNLENSDVEIVCEGEKALIEQFIRKIEIKEFPILVERIQTEFREFKGEFDKFKIVTGKIEEEMLEGFSTGVSYLKNTERNIIEKLGEKFDSGTKMLGDRIESGNQMLGEKIDSGNLMLGDRIESGNQMLGEKIDSGNKMIGGKIDSMHSDMNENFKKIDSGNKILADKIDGMHVDMNQNFSIMDDKYGKIMVIITELVKEVREERKELITEIREERKEYHNDMNELVKAVINLQKGKK